MSMHDSASHLRTGSNTTSLALPTLPRWGTVCRCMAGISGVFCSAAIALFASSACSARQPPASDLHAQNLAERTLHGWRARLGGARTRLDQSLLRKADDLSTPRRSDNFSMRDACRLACYPAC